MHTAIPGRFITVMLLVAALAPALSFSAQATKPDFNGYWWGNNTASYKLGWVTGYATAMETGYSTFLSKCYVVDMPLYQKEWPNAKDVYQKLCAGDSFDYDAISMGQFVDGIDAFYADYRNKQLGATLAIEYVRDQIKGKNSQALDTEVVGWRRCFAALQTKDAEQSKRACTPDEPATPSK